MGLWSHNCARNACIRSLIAQIKQSVGWARVFPISGSDSVQNATTKFDAGLLHLRFASMQLFGSSSYRSFCDNIETSQLELFSAWKLLILTHQSNGGKCFFVGNDKFRVGVTLIEIINVWKLRRTLRVGLHWELELCSKFCSVSAKLRKFNSNSIESWSELK